MSQENYIGMDENGQQAKLLQGNETTVGWISRQNLLALRPRENFFLDIPFYRTHGPPTAGFEG